MSNDNKASYLENLTTSERKIVNSWLDELIQQDFIHHTFDVKNKSSRTKYQAKGSPNKSKINRHTATPFTIFSMLVNSKIINNIIEYTNNPAKSIVVEHPDNNTHTDEWNGACKNLDSKYIEIVMNVNQEPEKIESQSNEPEFTIDSSHVYKYIAAIIAGGINRLPSIDDLFADDHSGILGSEFFKENFTKHEFNMLHRHIRGNISDIEKYLNDNFKDAWVLGHIVTIDERIIPFRGKVHYRCYIPSKPKTTGIKTYMLADNTNYCYDFWLYRVCYFLNCE